MQQRNIYIILSVFIFTYVVLRAMILPLYVDELYSFNHYVRSGFLSPFNDYRAANNHLLNTFLTTISYRVLGDSPLSIRLFNVLAFLPFAFYLYKIGCFITHNITRWTFYLVLLCSLNFLSYFSLSRGYGLSFALMLMSIYYIYQTFKYNSIKLIATSTFILLLALYANFSLLLFLLISLGVLGINVIRNKEFYFTKKNLTKLSLIATCIALAIGFSLKVLFFYKEVGELWWGSLDGFWSITILSLIEFLFRTEDSSFLYQGAIIILSAIMLLIYIIKEPFLAKFNKTNLFFTYLILNVLGVLMMAHLFEVNYPLQRTGLHLYVFFLGAYCFGVDKIKIKWLRISLILPLFFIPVHFLFNMNLIYVSCWEEDNIPDSFYEKAEELEKENNPKYPLSIYIEGTTGACWAYKVDNASSRLPNSIVVRENTKKYYDYLIDRKENVAPFKHLYDSIDKQASSEVRLYKRKKQAERVLVNWALDISLRETNAEFIEFVRFELDSMVSSSLFFDVTSNFEYLNYPFQSNIILSVENFNTKEIIGYKPIRLDMKGVWNKDDVLRHGDFINNLPTNEKLLIVVYVWNMKKVNYKIHSSDVKIYNVTE
jgi:hypothetical protein